MYYNLQNPILEVDSNSSGNKEMTGARKFCTIQTEQWLMNKQMEAHLLQNLKVFVPKGYFQEKKNTDERYEQGNNGKK